MFPVNLLRILLAILFLNNFSSSVKKRSVKTLIWEKVESNYEPYYCNNYSAAIINNRHDLNMELYTIRNVSDFYLALNIWYRDSKTRIERSMFSYNINICKMFGGNIGQMHIMSIWLKNLKKYSNMPHSCPWKKGHYYWRHLKPDKDSIPPFVSSGHYRIAAKFYFPNKEYDLFTNTSMSVLIKMQ